MVQPGAWWLSRWWWRHRQHRLSALVAPAGQGRLWSRSQRIAAARQPGKRQRRSRARTNRCSGAAGAVAVGGRRRAEAGSAGGWVQGRRPVRQAGSPAGGGRRMLGGVGEGEQLPGELVDDRDRRQVGERGAGDGAQVEQFRQPRRGRLARLRHARRAARGLSVGRLGARAARRRSGRRRGRLVRRSRSALAGSALRSPRAAGSVGLGRRSVRAACGAVGFAGRGSRPRV